MLAFAPLDAVVGVAHTAIEGFSALLIPLTGGLAGATAIVAFTIVVRLLISPLTYVQVRGERRRAALAPRLAELRAKYRTDPARLAAETFAVQRAAGAGPLTGCLPALLQAPFFMIMYRLVTVPGPAQGVLSGQLFGVPLTAHLMHGLPVFGVLLVLATVLAWWLSRRMRRLQAAAAATAATAATSVAAGPGAEQATALIGRVLPLLPYATVLMVAFLPLAAGLYLVTTTAWTALEHAVWRRPAAALINR